MKIHTEDEVEGKILDCIQNERKYVEWLCQNLTEKQLERKLNSIEKLLEYALHNNIVRHVVLIELWKDQINKAIKNRSNYEHLYLILKKIRGKKKTTLYERMIMDNNYQWFYYRIYDMDEEDVQIAEGK
ncbi:MAG: hypothetical protein AAB347_08275 [Bacteroidota bacterium]|mgnify:CR=1 FL=1